MKAKLDWQTFTTNAIATFLGVELSVKYNGNGKFEATVYVKGHRPEKDHTFSTLKDGMEWCEQTLQRWINASFEPASEPLSDTLKWFELAVPEPTIENICVQFGCDLEEQSEILRACNLPALAEEVESYANGFKAKRTWCMNAINRIDKTELLDGLIDRQVTGLGLGYMLKMNMIAGANEVNRSNFSKFENGKPVFDDNGKIKKGANYTPPQLGEFI